MAKYMVNLAHCPNVDLMYGQGTGTGYWGEPQNKPDPILVVAESLEDASKIVRSYITVNQLGAGNWCGGNVYDADGNQVAFISYNGRIWKPGDKYFSDDRTFYRHPEDRYRKNPKMVGADVGFDWHPRLPVFRLYWHNTEQLINYLSGHIRKASSKAKYPYTRWFQWARAEKEYVLWYVSGKPDNPTPIEMFVFPIMASADNREIINWIKNQDNKMFQRIYKWIDDTESGAPKLLQQNLNWVYSNWDDINEWLRTKPETWGFAVVQKEVHGLPGHMVGGHMDPAVAKNPEEFVIWGRYQNGAKEEIDSAETMQSAEYLINEYRLAFGRGWELWIERGGKRMYDFNPGRYPAVPSVGDLKPIERLQGPEYHLTTDSQDVEDALNYIGVKDEDATGLIIRLTPENDDYAEVWAFSGIPYVQKKAWCIFTGWPAGKAPKTIWRSNPDRWYCYVHDLDHPDDDYTAYGPEDAKDETDKSAIEECMRTNEVISMGHIIVYPAERSMQVANTILQQLGGNKFLTMTGARNLVAIREGLMFALPRGAKNGINKVKIVYTALDLYDVEFGKIKDREYHIVEEYEGITFDQLQPLFTEATGLDTHL